MVKGPYPFYESSIVVASYTKYSVVDYIVSDDGIQYIFVHGFLWYFLSKASISPQLKRSSREICRHKVQNIHINTAKPVKKRYLDDTRDILLVEEEAINAVFETFDLDAP